MVREITTARHATRKFGLSRMQFGPERHVCREHSVKAKNSQPPFFLRKLRGSVGRLFVGSLVRGREHSIPVCRLTRKLEEQRVGYREYSAETENTRSLDFRLARMPKIPSRESPIVKSKLTFGSLLLNGALIFRMRRSFLIQIIRVH